MTVRVLGAVLAALLALPVPPLQAQNFFQSLFGNGPPARPYPNYGRPYGSSGPYGMSPYRSPYPSLFGIPYSPYRPNAGFDEDQAFVQGGAVRTLCVRMCDGFYFPISYATPRSSLSRDADTCSASCGAEARLFYHPTIGGDVETMVDLNGMAYGAMPNAFKYRKTLVEQCRCRPQPWSETELQRHRAYAEGRPPQTEPQRVHAEPRIPAPSGDSQAIVARPQPIARQAEPVVQPAWPFSRAPGAAKSPYLWPGDRR
jgi:hypothetical protein